MEVNIDMDTKEDPLHGDDPSIDSPYKTVKFALHLIRAGEPWVGSDKAPPPSREMLIDACYTRLLSPRVCNVIERPTLCDSLGLG